MKCKNCGKEITAKNNTKFCCIKCCSEYRQKEIYKKYLEDNSIAWGYKNMQHYKKYFLEDQDHRCAICGMKDEWNGKPLVFVLDHINGNADDNSRDNLRLICPNCDSKLDTFKSKNKHSARAKYRNIKIMEPDNRNIISGDDDNVETLTDNADGNDVGIDNSSRERANNRPPK